MSQISTNIKQIEDLLVDQLADALEMNGYAKCGGVIRTKHIDGQTFLKLTELQLSLWRLPNIEARRLWSFIQKIKQDPTQFIINSPINNKPKVNKLSKPPVTERKMYGSNNVANFQSNKPHQFQNSNEIIKPKPKKIEEAKEIIKDKIETSENVDSKEVNSSTLTKHESKLLKNQLESFFKTNDASNTFLHNQRQPILPPKPNHLKGNAPIIKSDYEESPDDYNDGYLAPITRVKTPQTPERAETPTGITRNDSYRSSFLHRQRKNYDNLEIRPEVIPNNYEEQATKPKTIVQNRPLPPVPTEVRRTPVPITTLDTDEEELAEYTPVPEDEEPDIKRNIHRPLPPVPLQLPETPRNFHQLDNAEDDEELAEYTPVIDGHNEAPPQPIIKALRSPLPPLHIPPSSLNKPRLRERAKLLTPESDKEELTPKLQQTSFHRLKPIDVTFKSATLPPGSSKILKSSLPKPPTNLPMPPIALIPSSPNFLNTSKIETKSASPIPNATNDTNIDEMVDDIDEQSFYSDIDLAREPCYRETDRKGARRLLAGLQNGAFVIRPSRQPQFICTISIMHSKKMFNLGIERNSQGALAFGSVAADFDQPMFYSVSEVISYYSKHPLCLSGESILLKDSLPRNRH